MEAKFKAQRAFFENKINLERAAKVRFLNIFDPVKNIKLSRTYFKDFDNEEESSQTKNQG